MAGSGGSMMAPPVLEGVAESGYGVRLHGFHCNRAEYAQRLQEFPHLFSRIAFDEQNGFVCFIAASSDPSEAPLSSPRLACYVREPHKFFKDLPAFLRSTKARVITDLAIGGSLGSLTLTLLYRADA